MQSAHVEAPVSESAHAGVWGFDQPRRRGSSHAQFGFVQLLFVRLWSGRALMVEGEMPTLRPAPDEAGAFVVEGASLGWVLFLSPMFVGRVRGGAQRV